MVKSQTPPFWRFMGTAVLSLSIGLSAAAAAGTDEAARTQIRDLAVHNAQLQRDLQSVTEAFNELSLNAREGTAEALRDYEAALKSPAPSSERNAPPSGGASVYAPPVLKSMLRETRVSVRSPDGRPVRDIQAQVFDPNVSDGWAHQPDSDFRGTDEAGLKTYQLAPGVYNVLLSAYLSDLLEVRTQITVSDQLASQEIPLLWDRQTPDAYLASLPDRVEFTVVDKDGQPVTGLLAAFSSGDPRMEREQEPTAYLDTAGRYVARLTGKTGRLILQSSDWGADTYLYQRTDVTLPSDKGVVRQTIVWDPGTRERIVDEPASLEIPAPSLDGYDSAALAAEKVRLTAENTRLSSGITDILEQWQSLTDELTALYEDEKSRIQKRYAGGPRDLPLISEGMEGFAARKPLDLSGETARTACVFSARDRAGRPVANLKLEFVPAFTPPENAAAYADQMLTDPAGRLAVRLCPGDYTLRAADPQRKPGASIQKHSVRVPPDGEPSFTFVWNDGAPDDFARGVAPRADFLLRYADGSPAAGVFVRTDYLKNKDRAQYGKGDGRYTDSEGRCALLKPTERNVTLFVREGDATVRYEVSLPSPAQTTETVVRLRSQAPPARPAAPETSSAREDYPSVD